MSLSVGGYAQGYAHPGPMTHEFYQYPQVRYPDHSEHPGYYQNWMLNPQELTPPDQYMQLDLAHTNPLEYTVHYENGVRCVKRRITANKKERRRTMSINNAFASLRGCIPNVPSDTKLSKIKTLRLATSYIAYLMDILQKDDPSLSEPGFKAELTKKAERKTIADDKKKEMDTSSPVSSNENDNGSNSEKKEKGKGRTGWPQHVWASELKN